jgi:hypothetical protein
MIRATVFLVASLVTGNLLVPQPKLENITYSGSACPAKGGGLKTIIGSIDTNTGIAPLTFELPDFTPIPGTFGAGLRMCDIVAYISIDSGYKITVNARGTTARGYADLGGNSTLALRGTYQFAESFEDQVRICYQLCIQSAWLYCARTAT